MSNTADLQPVAAGSGRPLVVRGKAEVQRSLTNGIWTSDASTSYQLNAKCQDFITRYLGRSLMTPDDPNMRRVNRQLLELAFAVGSAAMPHQHHPSGQKPTDRWLSAPCLNARLSSCGSDI